MSFAPKGSKVPIAGLAQGILWIKVTAEPPASPARVRNREDHRFGRSVHPYEHVNHRVIRSIVGNHVFGFRFGGGMQPTFKPLLERAEVFWLDFVPNRPGKTECGKAPVGRTGLKLTCIPLNNDFASRRGYRQHVPPLSKCPALSAWRREPALLASGITRGLFSLRRTSGSPAEVLLRAIVPKAQTARVCRHSAHMLCMNRAPASTCRSDQYSRTLRLSAFAPGAILGNALVRAFPERLPRPSFDKIINCRASLRPGRERSAMPKPPVQLLGLPKTTMKDAIRLAHHFAGSHSGSPALCQVADELALAAELSINHKTYSHLGRILVTVWVFLRLG